MASRPLYKGIAVHEIGHNLGGEHSDGTSVMQEVIIMQLNSYVSGQTDIKYSYPSFSKSFVRAIFNRIDTPRINGEPRIWTRAK